MNPATNPLNNKTALVTGGARGLGKALCEALCASGARVMMVDMRADLAEAASRALIERGYQTMHCVVDVGDENQVIDCLAAAHQRFGAIDILINNAGVDYTQPIEDFETAHWDHVMATNLRGPFLLERFPDIDVGTLQPPEAVADAVICVLTMPAGSVVPEISVLPMGETSWP